MAQIVKFTALEPDNDGTNRVRLITTQASNIMQVVPTKDGLFTQVLVRGMKHNLNWYISPEPKDDIEKRILTALKFR
jgi:hypothetical protein